jgi:hypothetical protein
MNFKRLLHTPIGVAVISILLGLGLATLFRKVCTDKNCIVFNGAVIGDIEGKTFRYDDKCYKYEATPTICDKNKRIIDFKPADEMDVGKPIMGQPAPASNPSPFKSFFGF